MTIEIEPWGGIVVRWPALELWLLVDGAEGEAWVVWCGCPVGRVRFGSA